MSSESDEGDFSGGLTEREREALHEIELGLEWVHRAHGNLLSFHHAVGHAMDHFADAEPLLAECGYDDLARRVREEQLPRGVFDESTWSYDFLECFQEGFLTDVEAFEVEARHAIADGRRHVAERDLERAWKERAERDGGVRD
jgi:hypothetical protein